MSQGSCFAAGRDRQVEAGAGGPGLELELLGRGGKQREEEEEEREGWERQGRARVGELAVGSLKEKRTDGRTTSTAQLVSNRNSSTELSSSTGGEQRTRLCPWSGLAWLDLN